MFTQCSFMSLKGCFQERPGPVVGGMQVQPVWGDSPAGQTKTQQLNFILCVSLQVTIFGRHRVVCAGAVTSQLRKHLESFRHDSLSIMF